MKKYINLIIAIIPLAYFLIIMGYLPNEVPIHYGISGEVDQFGSKYVYLFLCVIPILIYILSKYTLRYIGENNIKYFYRTITVIILFLSAIILTILTGLLLGEVIFFNIIILMISILFIYFGSIFNKLEPNKYLGIRLPATLKNEDVWRRIHYVGGYLFLAIGFLSIILILIGITSQITLVVMIISLLATVIGLWIYSEYLLKN